MSGLFGPAGQSLDVFAEGGYISDGPDPQNNEPAHRGLRGGNGTLFGEMHFGLKKH